MNLALNLLGLLLTAGPGGKSFLYPLLYGGNGGCPAE